MAHIGNIVDAVYRLLEYPILEYPEVPSRGKPMAKLKYFHKP